MATRIVVKSKSAAARAVSAGQDVYRGYMPLNLPQFRPGGRHRPWLKVSNKPRVTIYPKKLIEGYSEEPEYPPINDGSRKGVKTQIRLDWYDSLKKIPTAERKILEISKHCEHYMAHFNTWLPNYNSLPLAKYMTNTLTFDTLPDSYKVPDELNKDDQELYDLVKQVLLDQIAIDLHESIKKEPKFVAKIVRDGNRRPQVSNRFIQHIIGKVKTILACDRNPQLMDYQTDLSPSLRSWWYHSGFGPPNEKIYHKSRKDEDGNINTIIQVDGATALNLRSDNLIEPIVSLDDSIVSDKSMVENFSNKLRKYGAMYKFKRPITLPGFWFEDVPKYDCPHTSFLSTDCLRVRNEDIHVQAKLPDDVENCLNVQAMMTAFAWLNSLSFYHGFTPFQELDYPFTSQVVTTDGQNWLFNVYQLNSHTFHRDLGGPSRNNICWSSGMMKLYETYENGQFKGVNDEVIKLLIRFMSQQTSPVYTKSLNLRPYLHPDDDLDEEQRKEMKKDVFDIYKQKKNRWLAHEWSVPLYEHIFYRNKVLRHQITHAKPRFHLPKPKTPHIFE